MNTITLPQELKELKRDTTEILQVNMGSLCNLACFHCHVNGSPKSKEIMNFEIIEAILKLIPQMPSLTTVDITGGTPELNPNFIHFVEEISKYPNISILVRWNPTVIFEKGKEELLEFYKKYKINLIASMPCYLEENVKSQRGNGVFEKSIKAFNMANKIGYGKENSNLKLDLVYNPASAVLPPAQCALEADYKKMLKERDNISFNSLYTITNMPIARFRKSMTEQEYFDYLKLLENHYNPSTIQGLMCRKQLSIAWNGNIYDCDFNLALGITPGKNVPRNILDITNLEIEGLEISVDNHCLGCTAGAGSSCGGTLA